MRVPANEPIRLGGGHCCVCTAVCGHIGGPSFCEQHRPQPTPIATIVVFPVPAERPERPCTACVEAVLGFPVPTRIRCGLALGHSGRHSYTITWGTPGGEG